MLDMMRPLVFFLLLLTANEIGAQTQILRGIVIDRQSEMPLAGATVQLLDPSAPSQAIGGAVTDADGRFVLRDVPAGRQTLRITYLGYEPLTAPNILVTAGKEATLDLRMQESIVAVGEVVVTARADKDKPVNDLATISARAFDTEQVLRYSGGRNDIAKLVANFPGVAANNDARNDIIIRGNSPTGVLWRMEGIPIPNPNHFSTLGTTGGPVSALNPNMIATSDFLSGAFPAEYGNALAGVFDINLRNGNRDRFETTLQLGAFSGLEALVEGPLNPRKGGSFVMAYRHSFVELANKAGLNVGTSAIPTYRDFAFNADFGMTKWGRLSLFGIGGQSAIDFLASEIDTTDLFANPSKDSYSRSKFGVVGLKHSFLLDDRSYIRTAISAAFTGGSFDADDLKIENGTPYRILEVRDNQTSFRANSFYNVKISKRLNLRAGALAQVTRLDTRLNTRENTPDLDDDGRPDWFAQRDFDGYFVQAEGYAQGQYRLSAQVVINAGLHTLFFDKTKDFALEPRAAINWSFTPKSRINLGYGMHQQTQPLPLFFFRERQPDGGTIPSNTNLGFTRSQHFVLGYEFKPSSNWRLKAETYYQHIDRAPVDAFPSSFSVLNTGADFIFPERGSLVNAGAGRNIGFEASAERFFNRGWYALFTTSVFDSKYTGSDGIERNTAFNGQYVLNALGGREFALGPHGRRFLTLDTKVTLAGGRPFTPVNLDASRAAGREILLEEQAFSLRMDRYFRWDVKFGFRLNSAKRKFSQTFFLDLQNLTNNANIFAMRYNTVRGEVGRINQIGFFPDMLYRIEF
ncbi:MAG: TonB-dependent receptor [Saprospiraceae bacterium]